jgi:hypothetical protein
MADTEKVGDPEHLEDLPHDAPSDKTSRAAGEHDDSDTYSEKANKKLNRRLDARILPLCCWVYLLNFLDRGLAPLLCIHVLFSSHYDTRKTKHRPYAHIHTAVADSPSQVISVTLKFSMPRRATICSPRRA